MSLRQRLISFLSDEPVGFSESAPKPVDQLIAEMTYGSALLPKVSRSEALSVPEVMRARNMICSLATLPLVTYRKDWSVSDNRLFRQIDPVRTNVVTLASTIEDLLFEQTAWWHVLERGSDDYPVSAEYVARGSVSVTEEKGRTVIRLDGDVVPTRDMIQFESPNPGLLHYAGRVIRRAVDLDRTASTYADNPRPMDYFSPTGEADSMDDEEVVSFLAKWRELRRRKSTAYVSAAVTYNTVDAPTPQELQLIEAQKRVGVQIANMTGLDPEDLGISTTSRTYQNAVDRRQDRINEVLSAYMRAITDRLSMGDITKNGYQVAFDLDDYLRADPLTRIQVAEKKLALGLITVDEYRQEEKLAPLTPEQLAQRPIQATVSSPQRAITASADFTGEEAEHFEFSDEDVTGFAVDREKRIITGLVVPYGQVARKNGRRFRFAPGSIQFSATGRVKLLRDHDRSQAIGKALEFTETPEGLVGKFSVAPGPEGDRALALAEHGTLDGLSVGVEEMVSAPDPQDRGVLLVSAAIGREVSLTAMPAFDSSRLTSVAASADEGDTMEDCATCGQRHAPSVACPTNPANEQRFSAQTVADLFTALQGNIGQPANGPALIEPRVRGNAEVTEPEPYRFDNRGNLRPGSHDFSQDLVAGSKGDAAALERAQSFMAEQFDVDRADVTSLNPNRQRPDMYVDQMEYRYPVWEAINKGTLADSTPFVFPKFNTSSGLVAAHTEGVEPTPGTFTATSQTVTPSAVSGKVEITRETWDQGGNPQVSNLIWRQMTRAWYEALEASAVAVLDAATPAGITLTTGGGTTGQTLDSELTAAFAALQFVRGGFSMDTMFTQVDLYKALVAAKDTTGRRLYPAIGPMNASGTVRSRFASLDINGVVGLPAWALAASGTVAASSYLFDREAVNGWATAPQRLEFQYRVAYVDLAIWGYKATAISDVNKVREVIYDPA